MSRSLLTHTVDHWPSGLTAYWCPNKCSGCGWNVQQLLGLCKFQCPCGDWLFCGCFVVFHLFGDSAHYFTPRINISRVFKGQRQRRQAFKKTQMTVNQLIKKYGHDPGYRVKKKRPEILEPRSDDEIEGSRLGRADGDKHQLYMRLGSIKVGNTSKNSANRSVICFRWSSNMGW